MRNEKYCGIYTYNKSAAKNLDGKYNRHKIKNDSDIIRIENATPVIVSKEDFEAVRKKLTDRKRKTASFTAKQDYLLTGKIVCGVCGSPYVGNSRKPRPDHPIYVSYRCHKKNGKIKCKNPEMRRESLESVALKKLSECVFDEAVLPKLTQAYAEYIKSKDSTIMTQIGELKKRICEIDKGIQNIVNVIVNTGSNTLSIKLAELEKEKSELEFNLSEVESKLYTEHLDEKRIKSAFKKAKALLACGSLENKRVIVERFVNKIVMYPNRIEIIFNLMSDFKITECIDK